MSTLKLFGFLTAWVFAAVAIAVVTAIVAVELLAAVGVVEAGQASYTVAVSTIAVVVFGALVLVPVVFRKRFAAGA